MDQRRLRARRAAAGLAAPARSTSAARRPALLTPLGSVRDLLAWCRSKTPLMPHNQFADMTDVSHDGGKGVCAWNRTLQTTQALLQALWGLRSTQTPSG